MKTFWEVIGIVLTVIALAGFIITVVYLAQNYDAAGGFSGLLRAIAVSATLLAGVAVLWVVRYQMAERHATIEKNEEVEVVALPARSEPYVPSAPEFETKDEMVIERKPEFRPEESGEVIREAEENRINRIQ
jgi:type VI protein secretion system component VasK